MRLKNLVVFVFLALMGCSHFPGEQLPEESDAAIMEGLEPRQDALTYSLPAGSACPAPVSDLLQASGAWPEAMTRLSEAMFWRLTAALYAPDRLTQRIFAQKQKDMNRLVEEAENEENQIRITFEPRCAEEYGEVRVRMTAHFVRLNSWCGIQRITFYWLDHGPEGAPAWSWNSSTRSTECATNQQARFPRGSGSSFIIQRTSQPLSLTAAVTFSI